MEIEGRLAEIDSELDEEAPRKARLKELEDRLKGLAAERGAKEAALEAVRKMAAALQEQRKLADTLLASLERSRLALQGLEERQTRKVEEQASYLALTGRAAEIKAAYEAWQAARAELGRLDGIAASFREHDEKRQPLLLEIEGEKARPLPGM